MMKQALSYFLIGLIMTGALLSCRHEAPAKPLIHETWVAPSKGAENALITIHEFSDFECPFCGMVTQTIDSVMKKYDGNVKLYFNQFPLPFHKNAHLAAEAMLAAYDQGKAWEMHDAMFSAREIFEQNGIDGLCSMAANVGLNVTKFRSDLVRGVFRERVEKEIAFGQSVGISGTPSFLINGVMVVGAQPEEVFIVAMNDAQERAQVLIKKGVPVENLDNYFLEEAKNNAATLKKIKESSNHGRNPSQEDVNEKQEDD